MITIPISEVRKFINAARPIKDTKLLPIYGYVKLVCENDQGVFYKSNGHSFVVCNVAASFKKNETLLIEEKTLFGFVQFSSGKEILISKKGDVVTLDDGARKISSKTFPVEHFSAIQPKNGEESFILSEEVLSSLFLAKSHILPPVDTTMRAAASFVHLLNVGKKFYIAAWNGQTVYLKSFKEAIPTVSIDPEIISVISKYPLISYSRCGNYDYFDTGSIAYGFIKSECKTPDIATMVENFKQKEKFTLLRKPIVDFCEMVINVNGSSVPPEISITPSKESIILKFQDVSENQNADESIPISGKAELAEPFYFQPKNMLAVLKDLGYEKITMSYVQHNLLIASDEDSGYIGSVMELAKL